MRATYRRRVRQTPEPMIELTEVTKRFGGTTAPAVDRLTLTVADGEVVVLVGPSGCGKTTTLKMINRLIEPTSGTISIDGVDVTGLEPHELRRGIGYVIQQIGLFPHRTVRENIATVPRLLGWDRARIERRVRELAETTDLGDDMLDRYPSELSGGQRQRVGVARALAADPPILLMDEPFGAVDPIVRAKLQDELLELQRRLRKTIVLVTHDIDEAIKLGDRVAILSVGGHLEQYAPPEELLRAPANDFVADFLGSDRGIKRLSLIRIADIDLEPGPVVPPGTDVDRARAVMAGYDTDWVAVVDGDRMLGWVTNDGLDGRSTIDGVDLEPFVTRLTPNNTLEEALDAAISSHTAIAAVFDGERFLGMITVERISREIVR